MKFNYWISSLISFQILIFPCSASPFHEHILKQGTERISGIMFDSRIENGKIVELSLHSSNISYPKFLGMPSDIVLSGKIALSAFQAYPHLQRLSLQGIENIDLTDLSQLKQLCFLDISHATLKNFNHSYSSGIKELKMSSVRNDEKSPLAFHHKWRNLIDLTLDNPPDNFDFLSLKDLPIKRLSIKNISEKKIHFLQELSYLEELDLSGIIQQKLDLFMLQHKPIKKLSLGRFHTVKDFSIFENFIFLEELDLSIARQPSFAWKYFSKLPLKKLTIWGPNAPFTAGDIQHLLKKELQELRLFLIYSNDMDSILQMPLHTLEIDQVFVPHNPISIIQKNNNLRNLTIGLLLSPQRYRAKIDWNNLRNLKLKSLNLLRSHIDSISYLRDMKTLEELYLPKSINDLSD